MSENTYQRFRVHVPEPDAELRMGHGDNDFKGIILRTEGGVFVGAAGFPGGMSIHSAGFGDMRKASVAITVGINGIVAVGAFVRAMSWNNAAGPWDYTFGTLGLAVSLTLAGLAIASGVADDWSGPGTVSLYGDMGVSCVSPVTFNASAGFSAAVSGGFTATLSAVGAASMNAISSTVTGALFANLVGFRATVSGDSHVTVAARDGILSLEGRNVEVGAPAMVGGGIIDPKYPKRKSTSQVVIRADKEIWIEPGTGLEKFTGLPTSFSVTTKEVRAHTKAATVQLGESVTMHSGKSVMRLNPGAVTIMRTPVPIKLAIVDTIVKPAQAAWQAGRKAIDTAADLSTDQQLGIMVGAVVGGIAAGVAATVALHKTAGGLPFLPVAAVGGGVSYAATYGVVSLVNYLAAHFGKKAATALNDMTYRLALDGAALAEQTAITAQQAAPIPKIQVTDGSISLSVGLTKLKITPTGIEMTTPPMMEVKINNHKFKNMMMTSLEAM